MIKKPRSLSPHQPRPASLPHSPRHLLSQDDTGQQTSQLLQHGSVGELENSTFLLLDLEENRLKADNEQKRYEKADKILFEKKAGTTSNRLIFKLITRNQVGRGTV